MSWPQRIGYSLPCWIGSWTTIRPNSRIHAMRKLRECVLRDLTWLLNADSYSQTEGLEEFPWVRASTLNFGVRDLAGVIVSQGVVARFQQELRQAILDFEPRIIGRTLRVRAAVASDRMDHRAVSFEIEGELWADPVPMRVLLRTQVNVETGEATVTEAPNSSVT